jgi:hypothetical protein
VVKGDIDSVCTFADDLATIVDACGSNPWKLLSTTSPASADTGSRFCVNSELCESPAFVRGEETKTVPLNWFPNIKIATVPVGAWGYEVHIHLYFLGVEKFTANAYMTHVMTGVVNAMFNIARMCAVLTSSDPTDIQEMQRFDNLETLVGRKKWTRHKLGKKNHLSARAMRELAVQAQTALDFIAGDHPGFEFEQPFLNGIQPEDKRENTLERHEMVKVAKRLKNAMVFTASLAGCKDHFTQEQYQESIHTDPEKYKKMMVDSPHFDAVVDELNGALDDEDDEASVEYYNSSTKLPPFTHFPDILKAWKDDLDLEMSMKRDLLNRKVLDAFRSAFATLDSENQESEDTASRWYVDIGFEAYLKDNMNLLPLIGPSEDMLKSQLREW